MPLVTKENQDQFLVPIGSFVKWARWRRWTDETTNEEYIQYDVRTTDPVPERLWDLFAKADVDATKPFITVLPMCEVDGEEREDVPETFIFKTFRVGPVPIPAQKIEGSP